VHKDVHTQFGGKKVGVLNADQTHGMGTNSRTAPTFSNALVPISAYGPGSPCAITEVFGQTVCVRPDLAYLAAHGEHVVAPDGPPLLGAHMTAIKGFTAIQCHPCAQPDLDEVAVTRVENF